MKLDIQFDKSATRQLSHEEALRHGISAVESKLKIDFPLIKWIIYDYEKLEISSLMRTMNEFMRRSNGCRCDLGFYQFGTNNIWISQKLLQTAIIVGMPSVSLSDVIIDEWTHYKTQKDHGTPQYEKLYQELRNKFYG